MLCLAAPEKVSALNLKRLKADNKTCGQSQKKRRPRASLFLEQGTAVLLCKTDRLRAPAKRRADAARPPQVRRKNRTLAAVTAHSRRDKKGRNSGNRWK